jgi:hypothetical protein
LDPTIGSSRLKVPARPDLHVPDGKSNRSCDRRRIPRDQGGSGSLRPARRRAELRHYALHASVRLFPDANKAMLAWAVGSPREPVGFYRNSISQKFHQFVAGPRAGKRMAKWWDEEAFERVISAIKAAAPVLEPVPSEQVAPRAPIKLNAAVGSIVEPTRPAAMPGKRKLEEMLRQAVENTARMPIGE